jgi:hypothetical protein
MPVPTTLASLNPAASSNSPQGAESVGPIMNQYIQAAFGFIAQLYQGGMIPSAPVNMNSQQINNLANGALSGDAVNFGQLSTYMPLAGGAFTGAVSSNNSVTLNGTGTLNVISTLTNALQVQANTGTAGANISLYDAASGTKKFLRCAANVFGVINNAYTAVIMSVDDSGNLTATANITAYSDERLKKDWTPVVDGFVDKLADIKLNGVYTRKESGQRHVGVGAQSFEKVLPEAIMKDEQGILSLAYGQAALVSAIELAKEVVLLRKRIEELESKL